MGSRERTQKKVQSAPAMMPTANQLQSRPFSPEVQAQATTEQPTLEDIQTQQENQSRLGHNFADIALGAPTPPPANSFPIQAKLTIGQSNDKYEQEADRVAQDVVQQIASTQGQENPDAPQQSDNAKLQRKALGHEGIHVTPQNGFPVVQRKLTPDQIKHANRIRKARGLALLPVEEAQAVNTLEEAVNPVPAANQPAATAQPEVAQPAAPQSEVAQPVANQQPQSPQSDAKRSGSNLQVVQDYSWIRTTLQEFKSWDKVKQQFGSDRATMWQFFDFRQWYVDSLIGVLRDDYPGLIAKSVGSQDPTSDYDITISTPGSSNDVEAIKWFNDQIRKEFGVEPGTLFDTNLYAKDYLQVQENIDDAAKAEQSPDTDLEQPSQQFGKMGSLSQDVAALVKQRRYMKQVEWDRYVEDVVNSINDPQQQEMIRHQYEEADSIYQIAAYELLGRVEQDEQGLTSEEIEEVNHHTKLGAEEEAVLSQLPDSDLKREIRKQLLGAEKLQAITHVNSDLVLKNSNKLYLERMTKVRQLQASIRQLGAGSPEKVEALKAQVKQILGEACFFAAEAYHSEGAVKHVVAGLQGNPEQKQAVMGSLKPEHFLQSFNEQLGDFLKDLNHYAQEPDGKIFYRSSKYLQRLFLAIAELRQYKHEFANLESLSIETAHGSADGIAIKIAEDLVAIRKGTKTFESEAAKDEAAVNAMRGILAVGTASALKTKILGMAQEFNGKVRNRVEELSNPGLETSRAYFQNIQ